MIRWGDAMRRGATRKLGHNRLAPALFLAAVLPFGGTSASAELLIFPEGAFMKVVAYEIDGDRVRVELPNGGRLTLSLVRVERIIEDEIVEEPFQEEPDPAPLAFSLRFDPSHPQPETPYGELIYEAAERHSLNPALLAAVVRTESAFDPRAVSAKGAQGLMQLMPATALRLGLDGDEAFEPAKNLDAGARYLSRLAVRFEGHLPWVLAAYNAGEGTVDRYGGVPPYRETRDYVRRVYRALGLATDELVAARSSAAGF